MSEEANVFIDGQFKNPAECPKSDNGFCPKCGEKLELGYGFAGGYGLGGYSFCYTCCEFYDFVEDKEQAHS